MTTYLYPPPNTGMSNMTHFRDVHGDDAMDVESSSEESIDCSSSARSQTLSGTASPISGARHVGGGFPGIFAATGTSSSSRASVFSGRSGRSGRSARSIGSASGSGKHISRDGPVEQITTLLTCGHCSQDVILSGPHLTSNLLMVPPSPVPHILCTNGSPTTLTEENDVYGYIQHTSKAIAQLNWEIARTTAILEMLVLERDKLASSVEEHKAVLSPWRRMPDDLLGEIFIRCEKGILSEGEEDTIMIPDSFHPSSGPLLISQVCKRWRTKALNMPELWSTIRIRIGRGDLQESRRLPLLHAYLERSLNYPLSICMVERSPRSPIYNSDSRNLAVGMLLGVARRWKRLDLVLNSSSTHWGLLANVKGMHLPLLERCTIMTPKDELSTATTTNDQALHHSQQEVLMNLLSGAGNLKELRLDYNIPALSIHFPYNSVTRLDLYTATKERSIPVSMVWDTLARCPNLQSLKVRCHGFPFKPPSHLYHNSLSSLDISIVTDSRLTTQNQSPQPSFGGAELLFTHFTPPNLTSLSISSPPDVEWNQDGMMGFIARCGGIQELNLDCKNLEGKGLMEILECATVKSSLEILRIDLGLGVTNELLMDLSFPPPSSPPPTAAAPPNGSAPPTHLHMNECHQRILVPRLKKLRIGGRLFISSDDFLGLVGSRRYPDIRGVEVLEEIVVDCEALVYGFMSPYLVEQLDELRWWGMGIRIRENGKSVYPVQQ